MSKINTNIVDYFKKIEELTNTNLNILKAINDSFATNKYSISVDIDDVMYTIPSCFSLENKLNSLENKVNSLINIPSTGEAYFNINGNTRAIELKQYSCTPNSINLNEESINDFSVINSNPLRELLTPMPFIKLNISLPNDLFEVKVRKIIAKSNNGNEQFKNALLPNSNSKLLNYASINSIISNLSDNDYEIYDKTYKLGTRTSNDGEGEYVIENIINNYIDNDGNDIYELKISENTKLTYKKFDGSIEKPLEAGCFLRTSDGTAKVEVIDVNNLSSVIKVKLIPGDMLNLVPTSYTDDSINEYSTLYFFTGESMYSKDGKYKTELKIPLTEDRYVFICLSVINSRLNTQSEWGTGLLIDTNSLHISNGTTKFADYYKDNVKNISDVLYDISSSLSFPLSSITGDVFNSLTTLKPVIDNSLLRVVEINTHLRPTKFNESISSLDELNIKYESALKDVSYFESKQQLTSDEIKKLNEAYNRRDEAIQTYEQIFKNDNTKQLLSYTPKYRIIGCIEPKFNTSKFTYNDDYKLVNGNSIINIIGMQLQYFYAKNDTTPESTFIFTDDNNQNKTYTHSIWNDMPTQYRRKKIVYDNTIKYEYEDNKNSIDTTFNQISIPITENESVSIRVRFIYDLGQPFNIISTDWSDKIDIPFDTNLLSNGSISDIVNIANDNMLNITANNIIASSGINEHMRPDPNTNKILHSAKNIDSGFTTDEQNVITLETKLKEMSDIITVLNEQLGMTENVLDVTIESASSITKIHKNEYNTIILEPYNRFIDNPETDYVDDFIIGDWDYNWDYNGNIIGNVTSSNLNSLHSILFSNKNYAVKDGVVSTIINIKLKNIGKTNIRLYSLFPGNRDVTINETANNRFIDKNNYCSGLGGGVWMKYFNENEISSKLQTQNQFLTFRINNAWTGKDYYVEDAGLSSDTQNINKISEITKNDLNAMVVYPFLKETNELCLTDKDKSYHIMMPGNEIIIPLYCSYVVSGVNTSVHKTISFDIRTSLYDEPSNYSFTVKANNNISPEHELSQYNRTNYWKTLNDKQ